MTFVETCGSHMSMDLAMPVPTHTDFVPVTMTMDLVASSGTAQLGPTTATLPIGPGVTMAPPGVAFGFIDLVTNSTARIGFDDVLVVTQ